MLAQATDHQSIIFQMFIPKHYIYSAYLNFTKQLNTAQYSEHLIYKQPYMCKIISVVKLHIFPAVQSKTSSMKHAC